MNPVVGGFRVTVKVARRTRILQRHAQNNARSEQFA